MQKGGVRRWDLQSPDQPEIHLNQCLKVRSWSVGFSFNPTVWIMRIFIPINKRLINMNALQMLRIQKLGCNFLQAQDRWFPTTQRQTLV